MSRYSKNNSGFTLVELLISVGIMSVIFTVVILNQSRYTDGIALTNLADEISSMISQAQVYSTGVKELSTGLGEFNASYGLAFSLLSPGGSNSAYIYFADRDPDQAGPSLPNNIYDGDWSCPTDIDSECISRVGISRGNVIDDFCVVKQDGATITDQCNSTGGGIGPVGRMDITFTRPSTEAQFQFFKNNGDPFNPLAFGEVKGVKVVLKSPGELTRSVTVYTTGQISVQ